MGVLVPITRGLVLLPTVLALAWDVLMTPLGYTRYVSQGGDLVRLSST